MKGLVHQASVRAEVVVALIEDLKKRGHRAYQNLDMERVRRKATETLPRDGIPPEIMHLVKISAEDDTLDRIQIQKEATPVAGRCQSQAEAARIFATLSPNAVVCERSSEDGVDVVAQRVAAFQDIGTQLEKNEKGVAKQAPRSGTNKPTKIAVSTGNSMIDQFKPWCEPSVSLTDIVSESCRGLFERSPKRCVCAGHSHIKLLFDRLCVCQHVLVLSHSFPIGHGPSSQGSGTLLGLHSCEQCSFTLLIGHTQVQSFEISMTV